MHTKNDKGRTYQLDILHGKDKVYRSSMLWYDEGVYYREQKRRREGDGTSSQPGI